MTRKRCTKVDFFSISVLECHTGHEQINTSTLGAYDACMVGFDASKELSILDQESMENDSL